jgi:DNA topoisomerase-1
VQVLNGKYGPYITDGEKNGKIPKDRDPKSLSLEECLAILAAAPVRPQRGRFGAKKAVPAKKSAAKKAAKSADGEAGPKPAKKAAAKKATVKKAAVKKSAAPKKAAAKKAYKPMSDYVPATVLATPAPFTGGKRLVKKTTEAT